MLKEDGRAVRIVPKTKRRQVFEDAQRGCLAGHFATRKVLSNLRNTVIWEGVEKDGNEHEHREMA